MQSVPSLSIIVELENAKNSDFDRGRAMLAALTSQLKTLSSELPVTAELIIVHDEHDGTPEEIRATVADVITGFPGPVKIVPCQQLDYYQQKNFGAQQAQHEAILLVDCDIIPTNNWLSNLLTCYVEEKADVVCGATHMEQRTLYEKAFALFWFFPLASEMRQRAKVEKFFANNVLFRAKILKNTPFPESPLVRGKCLLLAQTLVTDHRVMFLEPNAKVIHPPPNGFSHFVKRALCSGQDNAAMHDNRGLRGAFRRCGWQIKRATKRILIHRHEVGLSLLGAIGAWGIAASYFGLEFAGEMISVVSPNVIRKNLRV